MNKLTILQWVGFVMAFLPSLWTNITAPAHKGLNIRPLIWAGIAISLLLFGCGSPGGDSGNPNDPSYPNGFFVPQTAVWDVYYGTYQTRLDLVGGSTIRVEVCCGRVTPEDDGYAVEVW